MTRLPNRSNIERMNTILEVNPSGTLTLPKVLLKALGVSEGGKVKYDLRGDDVVLQPAKTPQYRLWTDEEFAMIKEDEEAIGDIMDKYFERKGLIYDPETATLREKGTPYMKRKKKV